MNFIKMPIKIVERNGDVISFDDLNEAESYMEPVDVRSGEYRAFDSSGEELKISIIKKNKKIFFGIFHLEVESAKISYLR